MDRLLEELVALERSALDRWVSGEPQGTLASFTDPRYDMIDAKVQRDGDVALLTFDLVNYGKLAGSPERVLARWNATEVYRQMGGAWTIVHSHWSFIPPESKPPDP